MIDLTAAITIPAQQRPFVTERTAQLVGYQAFPGHPSGQFLFLIRRLAHREAGGRDLSLRPPDGEDPPQPRGPAALGPGLVSRGPSLRDALVVHGEHILLRLPDLPVRGR